MINFILAGLHFIIFFFLSGLCSVKPEVKTVSKKEGETIQSTLSSYWRTD
uniref:Uncharacterized protein n=1 Tax=Anguilla anguilla TaxID=7936 RepID=A0A0E9QGL6_ANGAN